MRSAATKINWAKLRSCYGLNTTTITSLAEFQKRNLDARAKVRLLEEQAREVNFAYYHSMIKNKTLLNEIERDLKGFKPLKYHVDEQIKVLQVLETKALQSATQPPEPLALRLSSNLMIGVTRIFDQQYGFFYSVADVQLTHARIRKELSAITGDQTTINLPPTKPRYSLNFKKIINDIDRRPDLFTLPDDPAFIPDLNDHGWEGFMTSLPETSFNIELGLQEDASSSFHLSETPMSFSQHTLPRSSFSANHTLSKLDFAGSVSRSAINMSSLIEKDDDILGSLNGELFDFEFNADGEIKKIDTEQNHSSHFIPKRDSIPSKFDSDEGEENVKREHAEARKRKKFNHTFEETLMAYEEVDETAFDKYDENHEIKDSSFIPRNKILETSSDTYKNEDQQQKKKKSIQSKADISTELPSEDLISWRDNYLRNMERQSILRIRKHQEKAAINNADFFIWNFQNDLVHPALKALFFINQKPKDSIIRKKRAREDDINDYEPFETKLNSNYTQTGKSLAEIQPHSDQVVMLTKSLHVEPLPLCHGISLIYPLVRDQWHRE
ncbi:hypothetical protein PCK2_000088 [Pneumocystis canis]|nr:hypothetical protein PCK2_000088 [Pneumocystis canis]